MDDEVSAGCDAKRFPDAVFPACRQAGASQTDEFRVRSVFFGVRESAALHAGNLILDLVRVQELNS